jgi:hypothetical protein
MKKYIICTLFLCLAITSFAAFPVQHQVASYNLVSLPDSTLARPVPRNEPAGKIFFTLLSAYSFLAVCASILVIAVLTFFGIFNYGPFWFHLAAFAAGFSVITALIGLVRGEGKRARNMLFLSIFFLLLILIFL